METLFEKARPEDREEVIDLANYIFSHDHRPHDFPAILPKLYKNEYFMDGAHYLARENGKIKAVIGAYPMKMEFSGGIAPLLGRGIGLVGVHPYSRSRGYMKVLMKMALEDMKKDNVVFSCLGGRRQRYEYFGYVPAGSECTFSCDETNIAHTLGREWTSAFSIEKLDAKNTGLLDRIQAAHEAKSIRFERKRERLFDILSSWNSEIYVITEGSNFEGYFIYTPEINAKSGCIKEIVMKDYSGLPAVLGLFFRRQKALGFMGAAEVSAGLYEKEKISVLSGFAENYKVSSAYQFAVFDFVKLADSLLKSTAPRPGKNPEGSFVLETGDKAGGRDFKFRLFSGGEGAGAEETSAEPDLKLSYDKTIELLFSPLAALTLHAARENEFFRKILPLPLFIEEADKI